MTHDPKLFDILVCPKCRGGLVTIDKPEGLLCESCELFFAIDDGLPNMLIAEAKRWPLSDDAAS